MEISAACGRRLRMALAAGQDLVEPDQPVAQRVLRQPLQVQVERRVDVDRARRWVLRLELLADVVDEVGGLGLERAGGDLDRLFRRAVRGIGADEPRLRHRLQHDVASIFGAIGMIERGEPRR